MEDRECPDCGLTLPLTDEHWAWKRNAHAVPTRYPRCRPCERKRQAKYATPEARARWNAAARARRAAKRAAGVTAADERAAQSLAAERRARANAEAAEQRAAFEARQARGKALTSLALGIIAGKK